MAENKKSFVLYNDIINITEDLSDEEVGKLFKHIVRYVNDKNPVIEDRLLKFVFEPIKLQLKRDLIKYEEVRGEKSTSGRMGNLKRYQLDIYNKVNNREITLLEGETIAKSRKISLSDIEGSAPIKNVAKLAVNDTVTETVTETDIVSVCEKKVKSAIAQHTQEEIEKFKSFNDWIDVNTPRIKHFKQPFTIPEYLRLSEEFNKELIKKTLLAMQNWVDLTKKNLNANLTFRKWAARDNGFEQKIPTTSGPSAAELKAERILKEVG